MIRLVSLLLMLIMLIVSITSPIWGQSPVIRSPANMSQLGPLQVTLTSSTVASLQAGVAKCGNVPYPISATTATISAGTGVAYVYADCDSGGALTLAKGTLTVSSAGFIVTTGTVVPRNATYWTRLNASSGQWTSVDDYRDLASNKGLIQGPGIILTDDGQGNTEIEVDTALVATVTSGTTVPGSCTAITQFFIDTDASSGQKFNYCNGTTFEQVTGGGSSVPNCTDGSNACFTEEFYPNITPTTLALGQYNWVIGGSAGADFWTAGVANHPGILTIRVGAAADATSNIYLDSGGGVMVMNGTTFDYKWYIKTGGSISQIQTSFGLGDSQVLAPNNSILFNFANSAGCAAGNASDTNWNYRIASGGTATTGTTNMPANATGTWFTFRARSTTPGTILLSSCSGDGCTLGTETTVSTNVPSAALMPYFFIKTCESVVKDLNADAMIGYMATAR